MHPWKRFWKVDVDAAYYWDEPLKLVEASEAEAALAERDEGFKGFIEETERLHKAEVYGLKTLLAEAQAKLAAADAGHKRSEDEWMLIIKSRNAAIEDLQAKLSAAEKLLTRVAWALAPKRSNPVLDCHCALCEDWRQSPPEDWKDGRDARIAALERIITELRNNDGIVSRDNEIARLKAAVQKHCKSVWEVGLEHRLVCDEKTCPDPNCPVEPARPDADVVVVNAHTRQKPKRKRRRS